LVVVIPIKPFSRKHETERDYDYDYDNDNDNDNDNEAISPHRDASNFNPFFFLTPHTSHLTPHTTDVPF